MSEAHSPQSQSKPSRRSFARLTRSSRAKKKRFFFFFKGSVRIKKSAGWRLEARCQTSFSVCFSRFGPTGFWANFAQSLISPTRATWTTWYFLRAVPYQGLREGKYRRLSARQALKQAIPKPKFET